MEVLLVVMAVLLSAAAAAAAVVAVRWWVWRPVMRRRVIVQTDAGVSFAGVVISKRGPLIVLDGVTVMTEAGSSKADGQVVVDRARVLWMQAA